VPACRPRRRRPPPPPSAEARVAPLIEAIEAEIDEPETQIFSWGATEVAASQTW
jgi:hypothetical protein